MMSQTGQQFLFLEQFPYTLVINLSAFQNLAPLLQYVSHAVELIHFRPDKFFSPSVHHEKDEGHRIIYNMRNHGPEQQDGPTYF